MGNCLSAKKKRNFIDSRANVENLKSTYDIDKILGQGSYGKVFLAKNKKDPSI